MQKVDEQELQQHVDHKMPLLKLKRQRKDPIEVGWRRKSYTLGTIRVHVKKGGNVGIAIPEHVLVVDVDPKHADAKGASASEIVAQLEVELGIDLSRHPVVETGSGGYHIYMTRDPDVRLREKLSALGGAVEFKKHGKLMVAAGSIHPNGRYYRWARKGDMLPAPPELIEALRRPDVKPRAPGAAVIGPTQLGQCLGQLDPTEFRNYDDWRNLMFAVHDACGGDLAGLDTFILWSTSDPQYADAADDIKGFWEAIEEGERTAATLFWHVLERDGAIPPGPPEEDFDALEDENPDEYKPKWRTDTKGKIKAGIAHNVVEALRVLEVPLAYDEFANRVRSGDGYLTDYVRNDIAMAISKKWGTRWTGDVSDKTLQRGILATARERGIHPVREYLNSLEWDGTPRLESYLVEAAEADDTAYVRAVSKTLLYAAVGRIYEPGVKYDLMVILEGPQGVGKSMLVRKLGGKWALEGLPPLRGPNDKDVIGNMLGYWLIEIEELASMRKADIDVLKSFITKTEDCVRLSYRENAEVYPRQCVLIGTTNDAAYLRDQTGNRRFAPINVGRIDLGKINRDQLWAEAVVEWKADPRNPITLPPEIWAAATLEQEKRRIEDPWEERLADYLVKIGDKDPISTETLFIESLKMDFRDAAQREIKRVSQVMQRLGWQRCEMRSNGVKRRGFRRF